MTKRDKYYINYLLKKIDKNKKVGKLIYFPAGNMFWAKVQAVFQIFNIKIFNKFPKERHQVDGTIIYGIEIFYLFLVKMNGFYYKKIYKHF